MLTKISRQETRTISITTAERRHQQIFAVDCAHSAVGLPAQPGMPLRGTNISKGNTPSNLKANFPEDGKYNFILNAGAYLPDYVVSWPTFQSEIFPLTSRKIFPKMGNIISFETLAPTCLITLCHDREEHDTSVVFRLTATFSLCRRRGAILERMRNID